jgi:hypothetical protein
MASPTVSRPLRGPGPELRLVEQPRARGPSGVLAVGLPAFRFTGAQDLDPALLPGPVPPVVHPGDLGVPAVPYDVYHPGLG